MVSGESALGTATGAVALGQIHFLFAQPDNAGSLAEVSVLLWARSTAPRPALLGKCFALPSCLSLC